MSSFYGMDYWKVLSMPLRTFWSYNRQVDRLRAEAEQRQLRLLNAAQSLEAAKALSEDLKAQIQTPVLIEKKFDEEQFKRLQKMFNKPGA